jgi:ABC-2 type transport system ATP-binding protein
MLLAVESLSHTYKGREALRDFHLHLNKREIVGLVGPNGSGKSTLLRVLSTIMPPQSGHVEICGYDAARQPGAIRERIGVVFQSTTLDRLLTVEENLRALGALQGLRGRKLRERIDSVLELFRLTPRRADLAGSLSGGLLRRAELARAFLHEPRLLLLDEPSTGLDPGAREDFWQALLALRDSSGAAILLSTHLFEEAERCDSLCFLAEGRRVAEGSPQDLLSAVGGDVIALRCVDLDAAATLLRERFSLTGVERDGRLYLEVEEAHQWVARIVEAMPGEVDEISFHRPTLADAYRKFTAQPAAAEVAA